MLAVRLICVGKLKEKHYIDAMAEYKTRLTPYCRFEVVELSEERLPKNPSGAQIEASLAREASAIRTSIPAGAFTVALCIEGESLSSEELAKRIDRWTAGGVSKLCLIIGGSFGLDNDLKVRADFRLSMSAMTFPHHLARVMLTEQLYRAFMIGAGTKYHK